MAHVHHDVDVVEDRTGAGMFSGFMLAIFALIILALIAFAVLWSRPWGSSSGGTQNPNPGISDNSGQPNQPNQPSQPDQPNQPAQ